MALPLAPPIAPQLARSAKQLPEGEGWAYEPKWDGFRAIVFVDGGDAYLQSRNARPLNRYFPELRWPAGRYVMDGELVIAGTDVGEDFEAMQQRIHPAESRINMLADKFPAVFRAFDLLATGDEALLEMPLAERRGRLEQLVKAPIELTEATTDLEGTESWMSSGEGVIAKRLDAPYRPGKREGMVKVKRLRTADCIVVGWRKGKQAGTTGSLLLGLVGADGMRVVGHVSGLTAKQKRELPGQLAPLETGEVLPGEPSRWAHDRDLDWIVLRPELVAEVSYDQVSGGRIRHGARLLRWRDDKEPSECTLDQLS